MCFSLLDSIKGRRKYELRRNRVLVFPKTDMTSKTRSTEFKKENGNYIS